MLKYRTFDILLKSTLLNFRKIFTIFCSIAAMVFVTETFAQTEAGSDNYKTGLLPPTAEDIAWEKEHMIVTEKVFLSRFGLERLNKERTAQGKRKIGDEAFLLGEEIK